MPLHVRDLGSGPPVVFLHPGPGLDGSVFLPGAQRVADAGYRVLLVDLPGSGRSPAADWTLAGYAEAVEDFVNELGLQDWTLLGHSFGGYVAMQHVVDYATAGRYVASCTDAEEEPAPGVSEDRWDDMPPEVAAAFEREASVSTPEECLEVWRDQLPFFATVPGTRIHYGAGYSGNGVGPSWLGGQILASLALGADDEWSRLPLANRRPPRLPPEPIRYVGGAAVRRAILTVEEADEQGRRAGPIARGIAALPRTLGLRVGTK